MNAALVQITPGEPSATELKNANTVLLAPASKLLFKVLKHLRERGTQEIPRIIMDEISPMYWARFVNEKVISTNTSAAGGNTSLMTLAVRV